MLTSMESPSFEKIRFSDEAEEQFIESLENKIEEREEK